MYENYETLEPDCGSRVCGNERASLGPEKLGEIELFEAVGVIPESGAVWRWKCW